MTLSIDLALRKAQNSAKRGDKAEAEKIYRDILRSFPSNKRALDGLQGLQAPQAAGSPGPDIQQLVALYHQGQLKAALDLADQLIGRHPDIVFLHNIAGAANLGLGRLDAALACFDGAIRRQPNQADAHNNRGLVLADMNRPDEALASYDKAIAIQPDYADAYYNRGVVLAELKRLEQALSCYDAAIRLQPGHAMAHNNRGNVLAELKRLDEALVSLDEAIRLRPNDGAIRSNRGNALKALKRLDEALAGFDDAIRLQPGHADAHNNRGSVLQLLQRPEEALSSYDAAIRLKPDHADAYNNRGVVLADLRRLEEALASYAQAIRLKPDDPIAHNNRGNALKALNRLDEALASHDAAIGLKPDFADAHNNRGAALAALMRFDEALASYDEAIRLRPDFADAHNNRGVALTALGRLDEALISYAEAIRLQPDLASTHHNRAVVLADLKRLDEALASYDTAIALQPDHAEAQSQRMHLLAQMCQWREPARPLDLSALGIDGAAVSPFTALAMQDNPAIHLKRARTWAREKYAPGQTPDFKSVRTDQKLRIGYFSADFHDHATMYLMAELLELHDHGQFEIHAFSYGKPARDTMRQRLIRAVDHFHDASRLADPVLAALARDRSIDIAIDLKGYTTHTRSGLFAHRAAPIQINYLGYPGSMGADFIDYIIADKTLIPWASQEHYAEKVIYLPHSYQPNDRSRDISDRRFDRAELGLPADGFVFCCFNNSYKIKPAEFDIWMRLLAQVDGSVLWLLRDNAWAQANLRQEAAARGVDPDRLVFAERAPLPDHLARHRCADLFLDTFNYNAHTTASDALWAGLPVVTKLGEGFAARVAGSLLRAIGLPELVTDTPQAYGRLALDLATDPARLADIKARLAANRMTTPLFDTPSFARHIERAYALAYERHAKGLPPDHIEA